MHSILKDGSYIQYGPKIIPNPNAEGGGGGGESGIIPVAENIYECSTTSTSVTLVAAFEIEDCEYGDAFFIKTEDTAGARDGYFFESLQAVAIRNTTPIFTYLVVKYAEGAYTATQNAGGVAVMQADYNSSTKKLKLSVKMKYSDGTGSVDGSYKCSVYKI